MVVMVEAIDDVDATSQRDGWQKSQTRGLARCARTFGFDVVAAVDPLKELLHAEIGVLLELFEGALCRDFAI